MPAPASPSPPRAVIFDLWDTLTEPDAQRDRDRYAREVGEILGAAGDAFAARELAGAAGLGMRCVQLVVADAPPGGEDWPGEKAPSLTAVADLVLGGH